MSRFQTAARSLRDNGFAMLDPLPPQIVTQVRRRINEWIARGMTDPSRDDLGITALLDDYARTSYGDDDVRGCTDVHECFRSIEDAVVSLVGLGTEFRYSPRETQIALRFPGSRGWAHLDGVVPSLPNTWTIPSAVAVVYLSDVGPDDAPFTVWPGAFTQVQELARRCLAGLPQDRGWQELVGLLRRQLLVEGAEPVTGPAGTVFLAHPALPHCNGRADSADIRYALIRRYYPSSSFEGDALLPWTWTDAMHLLAAGPGELAPMARPSAAVTVA